MHIDQADVHNPSAAHCLPGLLDPGFRDEPIHQNVEMRVSVLLKFKNLDVRDRNAELTLEICSPLPEGLIDVRDWTVAIHGPWIKGERQKPVQFMGFGGFTDRPLIFASFTRAAVRAIPTFTINPDVLAFPAFGRSAHDRESPTILVSPNCSAEEDALVSCVAINLYCVKRRRRGGFAAAGDSVPGPLPTFRLG
jgi:hypothetical protein